MWRSGLRLSLKRGANTWEHNDDQPTEYIDFSSADGYRFRLLAVVSGKAKRTLVV
jgi:hypothetical protein